VLTTEPLIFKQIVTGATHVLVANRLPTSRLRDLLDLKKDWRDRLSANVADHSAEWNALLGSSSRQNVKLRRFLPFL
jgi:hypothetical protein